VNTEEHLVHRQELGDYIVNADGQRLLDHPYLNFDIRADGESIPAGSTVTVDATLFHWGEQTSTSYTATHDGRHFVIDPLILDGAESWNWDTSGWLRLDMTIDGPAGVATGDFGFQIYPPKPATGALFSVINFIIPFAVLGLFIVVYRARQVRLQVQTS